MAERVVCVCLVSSPLGAMAASLEDRDRLRAALGEVYDAAVLAGEAVDRSRVRWLNRSVLRLLDLHSGAERAVLECSLPGVEAVLLLHGRGLAAADVERVYRCKREEVSGEPS